MPALPSRLCSPRFPGLWGHCQLMGLGLNSRRRRRGLSRDAQGGCWSSKVQQVWGAKGWSGRGWGRGGSSHFRTQEAAPGPDLHPRKHPCAVSPEARDTLQPGEPRARPRWHCYYLLSRAPASLPPRLGLPSTRQPGGGDAPPLDLCRLSLRSPGVLRRLLSVRPPRREGGWTPARKGGEPGGLGAGPAS